MEDERNDFELTKFEELIDSWGPVDLSEGPWEADIAFGTWYEITNDDGIYVFIVKYSVSDYDFTVVP